MIALGNIIMNNSQAKGDIYINGLTHYIDLNLKSLYSLPISFQTSISLNVNKLLTDYDGYKLSELDKNLKF